LVTAKKEEHRMSERRTVHDVVSEEEGWTYLPGGGAMTQIGGREDPYEAQAARSQAKVEELLRKRKLSRWERGELQAHKPHATSAQQQRIAAVLGQADPEAARRAAVAHAGREAERRGFKARQAIKQDDAAAVDRVLRDIGLQD
jgi:hypothetical protein